MKAILSTITIYLLAISASFSNDFVFSPINVLHGLSDNQVRYILQLPDGRMVFKTSGNLNIYDGSQFKYIHQNQGIPYRLDSYDGFYRIYQNGDVLWIKDTHKLMCVDLRTEKYISYLGSYFEKKGFKKPIDDFFMDVKQRLWLLTAGQLTTSDHSISLNVSANAGRLQDVATDKNRLYLFYHTGEVICYDLLNRKKLNTFAAYPPAQQALFKNTSLVVHGKDGFYQLRNGAKGGFFFFDIRNNSWKKILETNYALNTLLIKPDGTAYISCAKGVWIIDFHTGEKQYLPTLKKIDGNVLNIDISTVFYDKQGGLWLGTLNQGLLYDHPARYMFTNIGRSYFPKKSTLDITVEGFAEDQHGVVYVKSQAETYRFNHSKNQDKFLTPVPTSTLPEEVIKRFHLTKTTQNVGNHTISITDKRGWKWTATQDGLKVFDPNKKQERIFHTKDGLSNNFIHALLQDRNGSIWISTSYGINKAVVDPTTEKITFNSFRSDAGTLEGEYADGAVFEATDGSLYFGGINGFSILKPDYPKSNTLPFSPIFTNLFVHGEKIEVARPYKNHIILSEAAPYTKKIELSYHQNFLTFEFSALNYQNPTQTYYRYQLEGIDSQWQETVGNDAINNGLLRTSYTDLPHGKYKLKVMASSNRHEWNGTISELYITINAPWWKTTTAYILFGAIFLILLSAAIYLYVYTNRKRLERTHKEEILLLRIRNLIEQQRFIHAPTETDQEHLDQQLNSLAKDEPINRADEEFLARALAEVEKNIDIPNYSVEQLSRDLFMDRTGLYRKLITLLDKSPSLFIRNVRLEKAAQLILEGKLSISEIADKVGFSSSSYLSKCFQEVYGCRPSAYAEKVKKST